MNLTFYHFLNKIFTFNCFLKLNELVTNFNIFNYTGCDPRLFALKSAFIMENLKENYKEK